MKFSYKITLILCLFLVTTIHAEAKNIKLFQQDSLQKILLNNKEQPFILIIWSISCSSCLAEMKMIQQIHQQKPKLNIIMLSVDGPEFHQQMSQILEQEKLIGIEQWGFAEDNAPGLRYVIDNRWYGELQWNSVSLSAGGRRCRSPARVPPGWY